MQNLFQSLRKYFPFLIIAIFVIGLLYFIVGADSFDNGAGLQGYFEFFLWSVQLLGSIFLLFVLPFLLPFIPIALVVFFIIYRHRKRQRAKGAGQRISSGRRVEWSVRIIMSCVFALVFAGYLPAVYPNEEWGIFLNIGSLINRFLFFFITIFLFQYSFTRLRESTNPAWNWHVFFLFTSLFAWMLGVLVHYFYIGVFFGRSFSIDNLLLEHNLIVWLTPSFLAVILLSIMILFLLQWFELIPPHKKYLQGGLLFLFLFIVLIGFFSNHVFWVAEIR